MAFAVAVEALFLIRIKMKKNLRKKHRRKNVKIASCLCEIFISPYSREIGLNKVRIP
jgi:hypothetical protein